MIHIFSHNWTCLFLFVYLLFVVVMVSLSFFWLKIFFLFSVWAGLSVYCDDPTHAFLFFFFCFGQSLACLGCRSSLFFSPFLVVSGEGHGLAGFWRARWPTFGLAGMCACVRARAPGRSSRVAIASGPRLPSPLIHASTAG
ncbi:hypothetical protein TW95_gp1304 [Pandoravirus inopinatum]|uniref:Uncharacterized protein n=1 Tax=Pandoravirus inopinatum TaxID=1605721 RepID=A0A0B5IYS2_9VIRU|nr:hypothetical protein TW95_gp1304 [Pandoravirus inopinatum]AJF98038.1 hypothetical protein [Pandoravirus inopinatum]